MTSLTRWGRLVLVFASRVGRGWGTIDAETTGNGLATGQRKPFIAPRKDDTAITMMSCRSRVGRTTANADGWPPSQISSNLRRDTPHSAQQLAPFFLQTPDTHTSAPNLAPQGHPMKKKFSHLVGPFGLCNSRSNEHGVRFPLLTSRTAIENGMRPLIFQAADVDPLFSMRLADASIDEVCASRRVKSLSWMPSAEQACDR